MIEYIGIAMCFIMVWWGVFAGGFSGNFFSNLMFAALTNASYLIAVYVWILVTAVSVDPELLFRVSILQVPILVIAFGIGRSATWMELHRRPRTH